MFYLIMNGWGLVLRSSLWILNIFTLWQEFDNTVLLFVLWFVWVFLNRFYKSICLKCESSSAWTLVCPKGIVIGKSHCAWDSGLWWRLEMWRGESCLISVKLCDLKEVQINVFFKLKLFCLLLRSGILSPSTLRINNQGQASMKYKI